MLSSSTLYRILRGTVSSHIDRDLCAASGHARMLLQDSLNVGSRDIPPASNTSLEVPIISYQLGSPASAPAKSPLASLSALTNMLVPALAPVALVSEGVSFCYALVKVISA